MTIDLSTLQARKQLVVKYAVKYDIDLGLVCAVIEQESSWDIYAYRFEPKFYQRYVVPLNIIDPTENYMRATSWGLMQVMGQVAREYGFQGRSLAALCDPDIGIDYGCKKLKHSLVVAEGNETRALLLWNGGGNAAYPQQVIARIPNYEEEPST